tara:strand:- start:505 stop:714 length:210 start_codon:yes stop_codon:yes gene_type:complete
MDMKMKKPKLGGHVSGNQAVNPLFRKQPELEIGIGRLASARSMAKDMKKVNQIADGIRVADMIMKHDKG